MEHFAKIVNGICFTFLSSILSSTRFLHGVKSVRIRSYSVPHFSAFRLNTERLVDHVNLHFRKRRREFFLCTLHLPTAEAYSEPFQTSKSVFTNPIFQFAYDFKLLTIYGKTLPVRCLKGL